MCSSQCTGEVCHCTGSPAALCTTDPKCSDVNGHRPGFADASFVLKEKGNFWNALKIFRFFFFSVENECSHVVRAGVTQHDHTARGGAEVLALLKEKAWLHLDATDTQGHGKQHGRRVRAQEASLQLWTFAFLETAASVLSFLSVYTWDEEGWAEVRLWWAQSSARSPVGSKGSAAVPSPSGRTSAGAASLRWVADAAETSMGQLSGQHPAFTLVFGAVPVVPKPPGPQLTQRPLKGPCPCSWSPLNIIILRVAAPTTNGLRLKSRKFSGFRY